MLKACFAFGIMNTIFFFVTFVHLLFMHRGEREVTTKETYVRERKRSHDSRYVWIFYAVEDRKLTDCVGAAIQGVEADIIGARGIVDEATYERRSTKLFTYDACNDNPFFEIFYSSCMPGFIGAI